MKHNLDIIDELFATLSKLQPLKAEDKNRLYKKFRLEFNYNSNHIEGNTLTYGETELLLIFDDTKGNHSMREYEETKAHDVAYHMVEEMAKENDRPLTEQIIKNLNEIILVRPYWKDAITAHGQNTRRQIKVGSYKEYPNSVRLQNGEMFEYASPTETPILMQELMDWYRSEEQVLHPVTLATMLHYKFVRIHPFDDGNGRISRLLMNYVLLKFNYPPVIIKSSDKNNYLRALHQADIGDYEPLIDYISEQAIWSLETSIKAAKGESLEETDDFIKEIELIKRKASSKGVPKSPLVIYDAFKLVNNVVWGSILETLTFFDTLFNETQDVHTVNSMSEVLEKKGLGLNSGMMMALAAIDSLNKPTEIKIFGHDVYKTNINVVSWEHNMYALRGSDLPVDVRISLDIEFKQHSYKIYLLAAGSVIYNSDKPYKEGFSPRDIDDITKILKKELLDYINTKID